MSVSPFIPPTNKYPQSIFPFSFNLSPFSCLRFYRGNVLVVESSMKILSVNTSPAKTIMVGDVETKTGIFKLPSDKAVFIGKLGLEGDVQVNKEHHGGKDQAVYFYSKEDYEFWEAKLGKKLEYGIFGENLCIEGVSSKDVCVGDRFRIGDVLLEATGPRIPCSVFAARMNDIAFGKKFIKAGRAGFYCRVINEGKVLVGDEVSMSKAKDSITMKELSDLWVDKNRSKDKVRQVLKLDIDERSRKAYEEYLAG